MVNFVKLTRTKENGGGAVWINLGQVFSMHRSGVDADRTVLKHGRNGEALVVLQTPDEIIALDRTNALANLEVTSIPLQY